MGYENAPLLGKPSTPDTSRSSSRSDSHFHSFHSSGRSIPDDAKDNDNANGNGKPKIHRVSYTAKNHFQVLFQMYGSAFPQVLPFCAINVLWTLAIYFMRDYGIADITFTSTTGHSFMGLLVSFLVVARSRISYDRFMEIRRHLAVAYRSCRELAQFTCVYTFKTKTEQAQEWRQEVAYRTILLLRVTMDTLKWSSTERHMWEKEFDSHHKDRDPSVHFRRFESFTHGHRTLVDENFRAPIMFAHILRETIMMHPESLGYTLHPNEYRDLLQFSSLFIEAFHGFRVLIFTPYPFSLMQMTRIFLFSWVYSLPLLLVEELGSIWHTLMMVFLITFGFVGTEYVSMALDDPFGDKANDIDEHGMALLVYEDIYLAIYRTDGNASATALRERVVARYKEGRGLDCYQEDLLGDEFWESKRLDVDVGGDIKTV
jgi:predicted membrane chloride channel (bestrophin family)